MGLSSHWRQRIRETKNHWVQRYFDYRIEADSDPYQVAFRSRPYRFFLVLSHMRSGSSLLSHLLVTNPEIIGYGETHIGYASPADFKTLLKKVYWQAQEFRTPAHLVNLRMHHRYAMDKLLHDNKLMEPQLLQSDRVYSLFLLRQPERSLASIADLKPHWSEQKVLAYYTGRLATLVDYAQLIDSPERALMLSYEQLLYETGAVMAVLQRFLQTAVPFQEEYNILKTTGMKGVGDSKGNIQAGKIVRTPRVLNQSFTPETLAQAKAAHSYCKNMLSSLCQSLNDD